MTSKEMEARSGVPRANIRYYEAEGLLAPARSGNGYRDYSEEDLRTLEKIKLLRRLGVTIEALRATGASYLQVVAQGVIPLSVTSVVSWMLYMVETNIRDATLVGILTGTGIGFVFNLFYKSFRYDVAGLVILLIVVVVICCESVSNYVRRRIL